MDANTTLIKNLNAIGVAIGCELNAAKITDLINDNVAFKVIERSY